MKTLIKGGTVFYRGSFAKLDIMITDGGISAVEKTLADPADQVIDAAGLTVLPGLIDVHTHLREPGYEYKETVATGTLAAAHGGYTTIFSMPNLDPVTDDPRLYRDMLERVGRTAHIRVCPYAAITKKEQGKELTDIAGLARYTHWFSDDGKGVQSAEMMKQAMAIAKEYGVLIAAHCEDESCLMPGGALNAGPVAEKFKVAGISNASEYREIERDLRLAKETGVRYHVCHVSCKESVELIRKAKREGVDVSCEVTPHHLLLNETDITRDDGNFKMNPPLRSRDDQKALLAGLADGTIDMIATDHAPHAPHEKNKGLAGSKFGVIGLDFAFGLLNQRLVESGCLSLERLIELMSTIPAKRFGISGGTIAVGEPADLALFDLSKTAVIDDDMIASKSHNTPFIGSMIKGVNRYTIVGGKIVWGKE